MRRRRLVLPPGALEGGAGVRPLGAERAHYIRDVLRLGTGDVLELIDGEGFVAEASVNLLERKQVLIEIHSVEHRPRPSGTRLTLLQAIGKGDKLDTVVRQAAELGVHAVQPVHSARAVADKSGRLERLHAIADDALRISGRSYRCAVEAPLELEALLARPRAAHAFVFCWTDARPLQEALGPPNGDVEALVGPEGGFTDEEIHAAVSAGFQSVHLGDATLRTETAGPAIAAILQFWCGALG